MRSSLMRFLSNAHPPGSAFSNSASTLRYGSDLFRYTNGRYLFNEELRRRERELPFNIPALADTICTALNRPATELHSINKFAEGGFNRILKATFNDGLEILARLPLNIEAPLHHAIASEAATLTFLRQHGIRVPKVHGYSSSSGNTVGIGYILLEKLEGRPLSDTWYTLGNKALAKVMKQIVAIEKEFLSLTLPACGSLYFRKDLNPGSACITVEPVVETGGDIVVGPTAAYAWWYRERASLDVDRGPWLDFSSCFEAVAKREVAFCRQYGKPRLHVEPYLRELQDLHLQQPSDHLELLEDYLKLAPGLAIDSDNRFARPTLRHPDFSPSNVLVNDDYDIVGLIDWQHTVVLPLCLCAGIPMHFQNWGDPVSESLQRPETKLPADFDSLDEASRETIRETIRRRLVHFFYGAHTLKMSENHFDALRDENLMLRAKIYDRASAPWEGNSLNLEHAIVEVQRRWPLSVEGVESPPQSSQESPVRYAADKIDSCLEAVRLEEDRLQELDEMREVIGIDKLGWVPDDEHLERAKELRTQIKDGLLGECTTEPERVAIRDHFPFDDHEE